MILNLDRLRVFLAVHRAGSVLGASRVLAVTPSAVSQSVKRLEDELGVRLFQRMGNRLEATDEAHELAVVVGGFEESLAATTDKLRERRHEPQGVLRIGAPFDFGTRVVIPAMNRLERFSRLAFEVCFGAPDVLMTALLGGQIELAYCDDHPLLKKHAKLVAFARAHHETLLLVCAKAFATKHVGDRPSPQHLLTLPHVDYVRDRSVIALWYRHHHRLTAIAAPVRLVADNVHAVLAGIRAGLGLGLVPEHLVRGELDRGTLVKIGSRRSELAHDIVLAQRKDRIPTIRERAFIEVMRTQE
ncbi:MAG: LysR family transcriptional regulator [Deltaproteobacteria bacterium]|nr:LysR family transcriptional regulator [Deltaproteobacteria bacterium]